MEQSILIRTILQRTNWAEVKIENISRGQIQKGLLVLFGVGVTENANNLMDENKEDEEALKIVQYMQNRLEKLADKMLSLRIFSDEQGKMNLSVKDVHGGIYIVSQFTLFADCKKGNRPSFTRALEPHLANLLYEEFIRTIQNKAPGLQLLTGVFGEDMQVSLCNDGPVTLVLEG